MRHSLVQKHSEVVYWRIAQKKLLDSIVHSGQSLLLWSCYSRTLCINAALVINSCCCYSSVLMMCMQSVFENTVKCMQLT